MTAECCVKVRCALHCAAAAAAARGAPVHSLQCCDVRRPLYLPPGCPVFLHLIPFAGLPKNTFNKGGRAPGRDQLTRSVFETEVSSLFIWFDCYIMGLYVCLQILSAFPALGGNLTASSSDKT